MKKLVFLVLCAVIAAALAFTSSKTTQAKSKSAAKAKAVKMVADWAKAKGIKVVVDCEASVACCQDEGQSVKDTCMGQHNNSSTWLPWCNQGGSYQFDSCMVSINEQNNTHCTGHFAE